MRAWSSIRSFVRSAAALAIGALLAAALMYGLARLIRIQGGAPASGGVAQLHKALGPAKQRPDFRSKVRLMPRIAEQKKPEPKPERPKPTEVPSGQVVETARPSSQEVPQSARYLGRYDMKVDREQKSRSPKSAGRDLGKVHIANPSPLESPDSNSLDPTQIPQRERHARASAGKPSKAVAATTPSDLPGPAPLPKAGENGPQGSVLTQGKSDGLLLPATSPGNVAHNIQALAGNPGSNDYLPDVDNEGDTNLLNTRAFRYWGFYQDLKDRVARVWDPVQVMRSRDPTGNRYGVRDRLTTLHVVLDGEGAVKRIAVAKHSGLEFLDDEAERAFTVAGPFPNPPAGLRNENGEIDIQFGFLLELSSNRFKFFRMPQ